VEGMMKAKYEKMIDAWVKKHYGDLERGVLSDEVKYKVLFKIYRKKYRKEKILAETFSRMLTRKDDTHNWSAEFDHLVKEYKNLTPKHEDKEPDCYEYAHKPDEEEKPITKSCHKCRHSVFKPLTDYMGAATGVLWCEKNKNRCDLLGYICDEFEE
jgi:hypothetical protein